MKTALFYSSPVCDIVGDGPGKASRYALRASRSVVVSLSLSRRNTTSESEETANQPLSQLR